MAKSKKIQENRIIAIIGIFIILIALAYIFLFSSISPFKPAPDGSVAGERIKLPGFLGFLGFYRNPYDNRNTFFLIALFGFMGIGRIIATTFMKKKKASSKNVGKK